MATLFRAAVMMSVLVGLPGAWIYYGPLPSSAQRVVDRFVTIAKEATGWKSAEPAVKPAWDFTKSEPIVGAERAPSQVAGMNQKTAGMNPAARIEQSQPSTEQTSATIAPGFGSALPPVEAPAPAPPTTLAERVEPLLVQLRQLGVAEYALERWGGEGKLYRFHCEMPISGGSLTQQFEAVTADPEASVEQVVTEVSQWRVARQAGGM
ncbi:hypothetical protein [Lacipirellula parvula]|uniref:Uncharacterized protein n=1 Tax=Lacipirellula parvula TaxID=2650471 RepID=A0A5K7XNQ7_9BACT|nr:hypothetical protein [Lacipirellula parvula]BBO36523.1 hypothetical protein PLANPX_6135 [Lacipirellula parvula]